MSDVERLSIAKLRFAGGKEHDVNYVSEVHYDAALAREAQLRVDRDDDANTFNLAMEKLQRSEAELRDELGAVKGEYDRAVNKVDALVESLTDKREEYNKMGDRYDSMERRLTIAEQRADALEDLLRGALRHVPHYGKSDWQGSLRHLINEALKPAAEGEGS